MIGLDNLAGEASILGAMLCEGKVIDAVADVLRPSDFSEPFFGHVYQTIVQEHVLGRSPNPITIRPLLEGQPAFADVGGMSWLADLTQSSLSVMAAVSTARQIRDLAERRRLVEGLQRAIEAAGDHGQSNDDLVALADSAISDTRGGAEGAGEYSGADCLGLVIDGFDEPLQGATCGVIQSIDDLLGPLRPTHLVIGAGRPGMGKTATALSYALGAAERGHGVLFVSLEMGAEQLAERMAADLCLDHHIPYAAIRDRKLSASQRMEVCRARDRIQKMPLQILDKHGLTIGRLRTLVRRWARRFAARGQKLEVVVVDYLQLLRPDTKMDRYEAVSEISRSLKEIAKENHLAVLALAQLSREVEKRPDKRPQLSDLRESGQIEQDADAVLFFLRHEYYLTQSEKYPGEAGFEAWQAQVDKCRGRIEFICAKRRNGQTGSRVGDFLGAYQAVRG